MLLYNLLITDGDRTSGFLSALFRDEESISFAALVLSTFTNILSLAIGWIDIFLCAGSGSGALRDMRIRDEADREALLIDTREISGAESCFFVTTVRAPDLCG